MSNIFDVFKNMERLSYVKKKIPMRNKFAKTELEKIWERLDECEDKLEEIKMEDNRFFKIIDLLEELSEKTSNLEQFLKEEV